MGNWLLSDKIQASWAKGIDAQAVIDLLNSTITIDKEGKPRFGAFLHRDCCALLFDMLEFSDAISETEGRSRLIKAVSSAAGSLPLTPNSILSALNRSLAEYSELPLSRYVLVSALSIRNSSGLRPIQIHHARIAFDSHLPRRFCEARASLGRRVQQALYSEPPKNYSPVRVQLKAKSTTEAAERAQYVLDLFRGIYNWLYNRSQPTRISFGSRDPVNRIASGPIHTLHMPSGELATDTFWYEDTYRAPIGLVDIGKHVDVLVDSYRLVQSKLRSSGYRSAIEDCIVRYVRALDDRDWHAEFLKLWGILEVLTVTTRSPRSESTIERASYVFRDHRYQKASLDILRNHRNKIVHASASTREIETYLYQLKYCVEALFDFHLFARMKFAAIDDAAQFLSLPVEKSALEARRDLAELALEYRLYQDPIGSEH